ncbi:hypothetical protein AVEN_239976-1 [Araneus ventricosus]|uniref:Uncharacterized protein n=1 Tax=Araneus ventricosus TaxID=182803 RepID=A0A4Y2V7B3_ARAVE|nr:hypothetical protein AVEN_239976-1 [Araneus ventricosus]
MLRKHITWNKEYGVDTILEDYKPPEVLVKYFPVSLIGYDKEGCPVIYHDMAGDEIGILSSAKKIDLIKFAIYQYERVLELMKEQSIKFLQQVRQIMREQIAQAANTHMMKIGSSVDCKEWWHEKCSSYEGSEHLYATTAKFSARVLLDSRPAYSYPPRRLGTPVSSSVQIYNFEGVTFAKATNKRCEYLKYCYSSELNSCLK